MAQQESLIFRSKDFFGDAVDATLLFYREDDVIHSTRFRNGYVAIKMPSQLKPGVYDVVARRDTGEYRIDNLMVSLASHYFNHSRLHDDLRLEGGNFKAGEIIQDWKFDPLLHSYMSYLPANPKKVFDDISKHSSNPDGMRWGGQITLGRYINISRGAALIDGNLIEWDEKNIPIPHDFGTYKVGIKGKQIIVTLGTLDYVMAYLIKEGEDWVRMTVVSKYHPVYRGSKSYVFRDFKTTSRDIDVDMPSTEALFGRVSGGKAFGRSRSTIPTTRIKVRKVKDGPVFSTDRLYVYATDAYFLLWEDKALLTALPRWDGSHVMLDWSDGLVFASWGNNGHSRWSSDIPHHESYVTISSGVDPLLTERNLRKSVLGFNDIAGDDFEEWGEAYKSETATMEWNPHVLNPQLET